MEKMLCAEFCQLCGAVTLLRMVAPWAGFHGVTFFRSRNRWRPRKKVFVVKLVGFRCKWSWRPNKIKKQGLHPKLVELRFYIITWCHPGRAAPLLSYGTAVESCGAYFNAILHLEPVEGVVAFDKAGLKITFTFDHDPSTTVTSIAISANNSTSQNFADFVFQAAVPKVGFISVEPYGMRCIMNYSKLFIANTSFYYNTSVYLDFFLVNLNLRIEIF